MEIKAFSVIDLKTSKAIVRLGQFKKEDPKKCILIYTIVLLLYVISLFIDYFLIKSPFSWLDVGVLLCGIFYEIRIVYWRPKNYYESHGKFVDMRDTFVFRKDEVIISSCIGDFESLTTMKYTMLYKVMETSDYFFLFENKLLLYIVDKSNIEGGTAKDIRKLLYAVLGRQYFDCKY